MSIEKIESFPWDFEIWWENNKDELKFTTEDIEVGGECRVAVNKQVAFYIWMGGVDACI